MISLSKFCHQQLRYAAVIVATLLSSPAACSADFAVTFLQQHCIRCHGSSKQEGEIRLDHLTSYVSRDAKLWALVREQLHEGNMPPAEEKQPSKSESMRLVEWIDSGLQRSAPACRTTATWRPMNYSLLTRHPLVLERRRGFGG
jgi:hypothetical protein